LGLKLIDLAKAIKEIIYKNGSANISRNRKSNEFDALLFCLLHTQKGFSMDSSAAVLNDLNGKFLNKKHISRQSLSDRFNNLPEDFFKDTCFDIFNLIDNMYENKPNHSQIYGSYDICGVDGSENNLSKSLTNENFKANKNGNTVTALNIGVYNVTRNYPITLEMVNHKNERKAFLDFVNDRKDFSNSIFVFDRGFDGVQFFNNLEKRNLKYVCRLKCNSTLLSDNENDVDYIRNYYQRKVRIIKYKIEEKNYYLATNLFDSNEFTIDILKQIYHERWTIEEFFKYIKRNFNFGKSELKSAVAIRKSIYCQLIITKIVNLLYKTNMRKRKNLQNNRIINKKTITDGLYRNFLFLMMYGKLNRKNIYEFTKNYIVLMTTNRGKHNERICITPYTKWYTKQHVMKKNHKKKIKNEKDKDAD